MNRKTLRLAGLSVVVAAALATVGLVDASAATVKPDSCPTNKQKVVDTDVMYENLADFGTDGHVWALDAAHHYIQIWRVGGNAYCMKIHMTFPNSGPADARAPQRASRNVRTASTRRWVSEATGI
jgi:hypothetical protein